MRPVFRAINRTRKPAALLVAALSLFLLTAPCARAANGNGNGNPHAFRVLDKRGRLVGFSLTDNVVAREINGTWVTFFVNPGTGIFDSRAIYVYYLSTDCTGLRYLTHYSNFSEGTRVGGTLFYPVDAQELVPRSIRVSSAAGDGICSPTANVPGIFGLASTVDIDSFGLELPFKAGE